MCVSQFDAVQVDPVFEGLEGGPGSLIKYNPLSNVSSPEVWNFLRAMVSSGALPKLTDICTACRLVAVPVVHGLWSDEGQAPVAELSVWAAFE